MKPDHNCLNEILARVETGRSTDADAAALRFAWANLVESIAEADRQRDAAICSQRAAIRERDGLRMWVRKLQGALASILAEYEGVYDCVEGDRHYQSQRAMAAEREARGLLQSMAMEQMPTKAEGESAEELRRERDELREIIRGVSASMGEIAGRQAE